MESCSSPIIPDSSSHLCRLCSFGLVDRFLLTVSVGGGLGEGARVLRLYPFSLTVGLPTCEIGRGSSKYACDRQIVANVFSYSVVVRSIRPGRVCPGP